MSTDHKQVHQIMDAETIELELAQWFSTYGILTSQRILERFNIHLTNEELVMATQNPSNIYYQLLRIPLKNILNGIIFQQAQDYQVYAQKLFIDYLLAGEGAKEEDAPGAATREVLEQERTKLMAMGESFSQQESAHQVLISESQASLIRFAMEFQKALKNISMRLSDIFVTYQLEQKTIQKALQNALAHLEEALNERISLSSTFLNKVSELLQLQLSMEEKQQWVSEFDVLDDLRHDLENILLTFIEQADDIGIRLRSYRREFYDLILSIKELMRLLPDNPINLLQDEENLSTLHFDAHIGDE